MKKSGFRVLSIFLAGFLVLGFVAAQANATTLTLGLDFEFSGATQPNGLTPWITAAIDDSFGGPNGVRLTMSANNLVSNEFVDDWYFNLDPALNPNLLSFSYVSGEAANNINTGVNAFQADGDGKFDIQFDFPPPPGQLAAKFTAGETSVYDLLYISPITASSFDFDSVEGGGNGTYTSAAHIQGIDPNADFSGWIGNGDDGGGGSIQSIPEPGTLMLLGSGLLGLGLYGRKRTGR